MRRRAERKQTDKVRMIRIRAEDVYGGVIAERSKEDPSLHELMASIAQHGLLQPIVVRQNAENGRYALVCGTRRLAACRLLGIKEVNAALIDAEEQEGLACFLEEHLLRNPPSPIDEALALETSGGARLIDSAEMLRRLAMREQLLQLTPQTRSIVKRLRLSCAQAYPLTMIKDPARQQEAAMIIAERSLTPTQARRLAVGPTQGPQSGDEGRRRVTKTAIAEIHALARRMRAQGTDVSVSVHSQESGMCIQFLMKMEKK